MEFMGIAGEGATADMGGDDDREAESTKAIGTIVQADSTSKTANRLQRQTHHPHRSAKFHILITP
jgi:hypothetical protein